MVAAARETVAAEQVAEAKEAVERIKLERALGRQRVVAADLEMRVGVLETVVAYLLCAVGEREEEVAELGGEVERLERG